MPQVADKKEAVSRPSNEKQRRKRPTERVPVSGSRDILTVYGKDADLEYRWVSDKSEDGSRIYKFTRAGWFFVAPDEVEVGQSSVYKSENYGSIVRQPDGEGHYLYLLAIEKDLFHEDQQAKQSEVAEEERAITREHNEEEDDGLYGKNKLGFDLR